MPLPIMVADTQKCHIRLPKLNTVLFPCEQPTQEIFRQKPPCQVAREIVDYQQPILMPVLLRWRPAEPSTLQTPVALPRSRKGLNFTGQGFRFMEGNSRALVKACVNRPASCPLPPEAGCPGGAPFIAIHAGVVSEILCIQLSVGGGPSYLLGGF